MAKAKARFTQAIPAALAQRPLDSRGYPIPHGVWQDPATGEYDFRIIDQQKRLQALQQQLCAVSGENMLPGQYWFIGGPASFNNRLFMDGPMLHEVAVFSLQVCPHLALSASQYRQAGLDERYHPEMATAEKQPLYMLGMAADYQLETIKDFPYVRAGPWKAVSWWRDGEILSKQVAIELLAELGVTLQG